MPEIIFLVYGIDFIIFLSDKSDIWAMLMLLKNALLKSEWKNKQQKLCRYWR